MWKDSNMDKVNLSIRELSTQAKPIPWYRTLVAIRLHWMILSCLYVLALVWMKSIDFSIGGLSLSLQLAMFWIFSNLAIWSSEPGRKISSIYRWLAFALLGLWVGWLLSRPQFFPGTYDWNWRLPSEIDWACFSSIIAFGVIPLGVFIVFLRTLAPTSLARTSAAAFVAASLIGASLFEFLCRITDTAHHFYGHVSSILLMALLGFLIGPRLLKW